MHAVSHKVNNEDELTEHNMERTRMKINNTIQT